MNFMQAAPYMTCTCIFLNQKDYSANVSTAIKLHRFCPHGPLPPLKSSVRRISHARVPRRRRQMGSTKDIAGPSLPHALLISFPGQGHVNPLLRLGKRLASKGLLVTFSAPETVGRDMRKANSNISGEPTPYGDGMIRFEFFDDEFPHSENGDDVDFYIDHLKRVGSRKVAEMVKEYEKQGRPVCCLIHNPFIPWVSDVAESLGISNAMLWVQSCASFSCYYHYYNKSVPFPSESEPETDVQLPCMPLLKYDEIPSFLHPSSPLPFLARAILGQFKNLSKPFCILMDTFQELEGEVLEYMCKFCPIRTVGPLFKDPEKLAGSSEVRGDFVKVDDCIEWLDSKPPASVVYISFGSIAVLKQEQVDEIAEGLLSSGLNFLWSMKPPSNWAAFKPAVLPDGFLERAGERGRVVQWCPQERVLAHPSVACFVTHCGWNSSMEALTIGTPTIAFPQWGDQVTNAKYSVDVFKTGLRLCRGEAEDRLIPREEIEKCLVEATSGPTAAKIRENASKWKKKAEEAVEDGGSSDRNMQRFVNEILHRTSNGKVEKHLSNGK
nr:limonoid UDP-glucosyltransferase-like [Ipomoea batatas]